MTCSIAPISKTTDAATRDQRRPKREAIGQMKKHPKNAPPWRTETAFAFTEVDCEEV